MEGESGAGGGDGLAPLLGFFEVGGVRVGDLDVGVGRVRAAGDVVENLLAGDAIDDDGGFLGEVPGGCGLGGGRSYRLLRGELFWQVAGVSGVLVEGIEGVRDAAEAAETLQAGDGSGERYSLGGLNLFRQWGRRSGGRRSPARLWPQDLPA